MLIQPGAFRELSAGSNRASDITRVRHRTAQERHRAAPSVTELPMDQQYDPRTGLFHRRNFEEAVLAAHTADVRRHGDRGTLVVLDLDHLYIGEPYQLSKRCATDTESVIYSVSNTKGRVLPRRKRKRYPATTYSPTPLPGQYHRRWWA